MELLEIEIKIKLHDIWKVDLNWGWYPINSTINPIPGDIEVFQDKYIFEESEQILKGILVDHFETKELIVLSEAEDFEIQSLNEVEWYYDGLEKIVTNNNCEFCFYASHESSFTVGSSLILRELKNKWVNYNQRIWTTPFYK